MSAITDFRDAVEASFTKISTDLDSLKTDIADLNAQIAALQPNPADQAALDQVKADAAALMAKADNTVPPPLPAAPIK